MSITETSRGMHDLSYLNAFCVFQIYFTFRKGLWASSFNLCFTRKSYIERTKCFHNGFISSTYAWIYMSIELADHI